MDNGLAKIHLSVDCAVLGFNGTRLEVLLIRRTGIEDGQAFHDMKLPGSLILDNEELDDAARRVLAELTGLKNIPLVQFQSFGSINRTRTPRTSTGWSTPRKPTCTASSRWPTWPS